MKKLLESKLSFLSFSNFKLPYFSCLFTDRMNLLEHFLLYFCVKNSKSSRVTTILQIDYSLLLLVSFNNYQHSEKLYKIMSYI